MSFWSDIFSSPRGEAAQGLYNQAQGLQNYQGGTTDLSSMYKNFGLQPFDINQYNTDVAAKYLPARRNLSTRLSQSLGRASARMSSSNATPEMSFSNVEGAYAPEFGNLEQGQAQENLAGLDKQRQAQQFNASLLNNILGQNNQFGFNKLGAEEGAMQGLSGSSPFEDVLAGLGTAANVAGGLGWNPSGSKRNQGGGTTVKNDYSSPYGG